MCLPGEAIGDEAILPPHVPYSLASRYEAPTRQP